VHSGRAEGDLLYASKLRRTRWNLPDRDQWFILCVKWGPVISKRLKRPAKDAKTNLRPDSL